MITSDYLLGVTTAIIAMVVYTVYKTLTLPKRTRENIPVEGDPNVRALINQCCLDICITLAC
jgi:hypothetical protein